MDGRKHHRVPVRARVWCEGEELTLYVPALDVSAGGLCVRTSRPFAQGLHVRLGVSGPEGEAVARARVAWSREGGDEAPAMGLELIDFVQGREIFEAILERARAREE